MSPSPLQWTKERLDHEQPHIVLAEKTRWFKSPLVKDPMRRPSSAVPPDELDKDWDDPTGAHGELDGYPPFQRYEEPTLLEILYDLFFAANYNVFAQNQSVTNHQRFKAYVGYFSLLWGTWFVVALYDVRYVTDSMFERLARAVQLGVLVGFTVVAPLFDPEAQNKSTMMTMSLILCASRVCLAVEYANTLAHVFKYKRARNPLYLQIALNVIAAAVYLGVTFRFEKENSHVYITWYIFAAGEAILALVLSNFWRTLSFTRTHLMKRMSLITVMILGEGIQSVAQNIATIVKSPSAWNPYTVGVITSATATIYFVFLVYFDWTRQFQLPAMRQQIWTALHYPFHLSLVLFMQGFTQLILWGKAVNVFHQVADGWLLGTSNDDVGLLGNVTSQDIADAFTNKTAEIFESYPPKYSDTWPAVNNSIANISSIPNDLWSRLAYYAQTNDDSRFTDDDPQNLLRFFNQVTIIISAITNSIFTSFSIDLSTEVKQKHPGDDSPVKAAETQVTISDKTQDRYRLVFAYTYIACGCTLFLLVIMALVSRMSPVGRWPRWRFVTCALIGLGIGLTAIMFYGGDKTDNFLAGPWVIPVVLFAWLAAMIMAHIRGGRWGKTLRNVWSLFRYRTRKTPPVEIELDRLQVPLQVRVPNRTSTGLPFAPTLSNGGRHEGFEPV